MGSHDDELEWYKECAIECLRSVIKDHEKKKGGPVELVSITLHEEVGLPLWGKIALGPKMSIDKYLEILSKCPGSQYYLNGSRYWGELPMEDYRGVIDLVRRDGRLFHPHYIVAYRFSDYSAEYDSGSREDKVQRCAHAINLDLKAHQLLCNAINVDSNPENAPPEVVKIRKKVLEALEDAGVEVVI